MAMAANYPIQMDLDAPLTVARWRVIGNYIMAIPHVIVAYVLFLVAYVCIILSWFAIVFTGNQPEGLANVIVMAFRYQWRMVTFMYFMREQYPPFDFTTTAADPGVDPQAHYNADITLTGRNRLTVFFRGILAIPQFLVLVVLGIGVAVSVLIGFFAVLFTGKWPEGLRNYVLNVIKWGLRVGGYYGLLTDVYPPFAFV